MHSLYHYFTVSSLWLNRPIYFRVKKAISARRQWGLTLTINALAFRCRENRKWLLSIGVRSVDGVARAIAARGWPWVYCPLSPPPLPPSSSSLTSRKMWPTPGCRYFSVLSSLVHCSDIFTTYVHTVKIYWASRDPGILASVLYFEKNWTIRNVHLLPLASLETEWLFWIFCGWNASQIDFTSLREWNSKQRYPRRQTQA